MRKEDIVVGNVYELVTSINGNKEGTKIVFKWWVKDSKLGICNPVGEPDMQSSFSISPDDIREVSTKYQLTLSEKQFDVLIKALDVFSRIGMGQLEIVAESISDQYNDKYSHETMTAINHCLYTAKIVLGHPVNGSYGIMGPNTPKTAQIAYDIQCVLKEQKSDTWNKPIHADRDTPLAELKVL